MYMCGCQPVLSLVMCWHYLIIHMYDVMKICRHTDSTGNAAGHQVLYLRTGTQTRRREQALKAASAMDMPDGHTFTLYLVGDER